MGEIELPAVDLETDLLAALQVMENSGKSGIVVKRPGRPVVVGAKELLEAVRDERCYPTVGDVDWGGSTLHSPMASGSSSLLEDDAMKKRLADVFAQSRVPYVVVSVDADKAKVITDSEGRGDALRAQATLCRCTQDQRHCFQPHELFTPGKCNFDPSDVVCK